MNTCVLQGPHSGLYCSDDREMSLRFYTDAWHWLGTSEESVDDLKVWMAGVERSEAPGIFSSTFGGLR